GALSAFRASHHGATPVSSHTAKNSDDVATSSASQAPESLPQQNLSNIHRQCCQHRQPKDSEKKTLNRF
ncbi:hypothetical protein, partial [Ruegeria sp. HKCCD6604]|uniref:hypothetical protein n=1 Tax=Ruegeria sp. HKCCD6604 TaxID=2683000 RepID=UPI001C117F87